MTHQGTPIFMAREAVQCRPIASHPWTGVFYGLPRLSDEAHQYYDVALQSRLASFPQPSTHQQRFVRQHREWIDFDYIETLRWSHALRHDAESAFWLLVWWAVHIRSADSEDVSFIPSDVWSDLTTVDVDTKKDNRGDFLTGLIKTPNQPWLDPGYNGLAPLFQEMVQQICADLYWVKEGAPLGEACPVEMEKPDFLHEALQRLIFNFLIAHRDEEWMTSPKHADHRKTELQSRNTDASTVTPMSF